jgi:hypothetical protein
MCAPMNLVRLLPLVYGRANAYTMIMQELSSELVLHRLAVVSRD